LRARGTKEIQQKAYQEVWERSFERDSGQSDAKRVRGKGVLKRFQIEATMLRSSGDDLEEDMDGDSLWDSEENVMVRYRKEGPGVVQASENLTREILRDFGSLKINWRYGLGYFQERGLQGTQETLKRIRQECFVEILEKPSRATLERGYGESWESKETWF
jgi:hypothetical protein